MANKDNTLKQIDIGFAGGQAVSVRVTVSDLDDFSKAVRGGEGWYDLPTDDGPITLNVAKVVFVKSDASEHGVGFSGL
jgi:hypothetical protein